MGSLTLKRTISPRLTRVMTAVLTSTTAPRVRMIVAPPNGACGRGGCSFHEGLHARIFAVPDKPMAGDDDAEIDRDEDRDRRYDGPKEPTD